MPKQTAEVWNDIRMEFIRTDCTYQHLSDRYGVTPQVIQKKAIREGWPVLKAKWKEQVKLVAEEKMIDADAERVAKRMEILDLFAEKIMLALDRYDPEDDKSSIKQLTSAFKDVLDMQATTAGKATQQIEVVFAAGEDSWNE